MCAPMAALGLAASVAQSVVGYGAQMADYNQQVAVYNTEVAQWKQNITNSFAAARDDHDQLTLRHMQEQDATGQKIKLAQIEEAKAKADARVRAADSGVSGLSIDALMSDISAEASFNRINERTNLAWTAQQITMKQRGAVHQARSRINSIPVPVPPKKPSPAGMIVGVLGAGVRAYGVTQQQ